MATTLDPIQQVRIMVQDTAGPGLYFLDDETIQYLLDVNNGNIQRASLAAARLILMQLAMNSTDEKVDVLSLSGSKAAEQYRLALQLFLKDPSMNPALTNAKGWAGGINLKEMRDNDHNPENNIIRPPSKGLPGYPGGHPSGPFGWSTFP